MIVYLIRHGQREPNHSEIPNPVRLTEKGIEQSRYIGHFLKGNPVEIALISPKWRTIQTALVAVGLKAPMHIWPCLIEHDLYGPLDFRADLIPSYCHFERRRALPDSVSQESFSEAVHRANFTYQCVKHLRKERIAIFSHKVFNSLFIWAWLQAPGLREKDCYQQDEACINILETGKIPIVNSLGHLPDAPPQQAFDFESLVAALALALET